MSYLKTVEIYILGYWMLLFGVFAISCSKIDQRQGEVTTPELKVELSLDQFEGVSVAKASFKVADGWHIYGPTPQKNGRPTTIAFSSEQNAFGPLKWPTTKIFDEGESGPSEGFDGYFDVIAKFKEPVLSKSTLRLKVTWVACKDLCVPGQAELAVEQ